MYNRERESRDKTCTEKVSRQLLSESEKGILRA